MLGTIIASYMLSCQKLKKKTSLSFADTVAPSVLQFETLAKYEIIDNDTVLERAYDFASGEILALLSNNAFTLAEAVVTVDKFKTILQLIEVSTALDMEAEQANPFIVSKEAEEVAQWSFKKEVIKRLRDLLGNSNIFVQTPSSLHPYVSLRASPDHLATAWEALTNSECVLEQLINSHQSNPAIVGPWNSNCTSVKIGPVAHFDTTRLFCSLSSLQQAMGCLAVSIGQRTQYRINADGMSVPALPNRRMLVWGEASVRDCIMASQAVPPAMGRMNSCGGYDWAAPSAHVCASLSQLYESLVRVLGVNLVVASAVIMQKMGDKAQELLGDGCKEIFQRVQASSFTNLEDTEQFSFEKLFESLEL
jgi:histidine ammonia-lyase